MMRYLLLCASFLALGSAGCAHRVQVSGARRARPTPLPASAAGTVYVQASTPPPSGAVVVQGSAPRTAPARTDGGHVLTLRITADDAFRAYLDGALIAEDGDWRTGEVVEVAVGPGSHVLAVEAEDRYSVIAGMIAAVYVDGQLVARTGDGVFRATANPPPGFEQPGFSDAAWTAAQRCEDTRSWGSAPGAVTQTGAAWVWAGRCRGLGRSGFRLSFDL